MNIKAKVLLTDGNLSRGQEVTIIHIETRKKALRDEFTSISHVVSASTGHIYVIPSNRLRVISLDTEIEEFKSWISDEFNKQFIEFLKKEREQLFMSGGEIGKRNNIKGVLPDWAPDNQSLTDEDSKGCYVMSKLPTAEEIIDENLGGLELTMDDDMWHFYKDVIRQCIESHTQAHTKELRERVKELETESTHDADSWLKVSKTIDTLKKRAEKAESQFTKYREVLRQLHRGRMCSHAGDELIEEALKQQDDEKPI